MAKDVDAGEVVVSSIRAGIKREFAMMMKAQSEMGGELSVGRRMVTRSQNIVGSGKDNVGSCGKRMKKKDGEKSGRKDIGKVDDEAESGLVDLGIDVRGGLRSLESEQVGEWRNEGGDMVPDSKERSVQPLCTESGVGPVLSGGIGTSTSHLSNSKKPGCLRTCRFAIFVARRHGSSLILNFEGLSVVLEYCVLVKNAREKRL